jgi:single-stranded-DNA-specific exonuclease
VVAKEGWHEGVLGIVASKLADRFYRPAIVISLNKDLCKGSGRSIKNFHLFHALLECKEHLETFGGHSHAVGLIISRDNISNFKKEINRLAKEKLKLEDLLPCLEIDMELSLAELSDELAFELGRLEPFGSGNPEPLFYTRNIGLKGEPQVLSRDTLKFWVTDGVITYPVIGFGMGSFKDSLLNAKTLDLVYSLGIDTWQGDNSVILEAKDIFFR